MENGLISVEDTAYKQILIDLLARIHRVCEENNIRYTIAYGSLLGAIRHGGFIPWDDDIDICMPREEYPRFAEAFPSSDGRYYVLDPSRSQSYAFSHNRACDGSIILKSVRTETVDDFGAYIDVFLQDRWPAEDEERKRFHQAYREAQRKVKYAMPWRAFKTSSMRKKMAILFHVKDRVFNHLIVGMKRRVKERDALLSRYSDTDTGWRNVASRISRWYMREEDLDDRILIPFENIEVYAPRHYDDLLTQHYGDYMKLPPEEKRVKVHHYVPYWVDHLVL